MSDAVFKVITDRILQYLEEGVVPWRCGWTNLAPTNLATKKVYKGVNLFILGISRFSSPYWVGYEQAKKLGGHVRKGEASTPVLIWIPSDDKEVGDDGKKKKRFFSRYTKVWNVSQCDGLEDKIPAVSERPPFNPIEECERIVSGYAGGPAIEHGGNRACYIPSQDVIHMPSKDSFTTPEEYYSTIFHEVVHSTGSEKRLSRKGITDPIKFGSHDYSEEELVAEMGAAYLCGLSGIANRTLENSAAYIKSWCAKLRNDPRMVVNAGAQAVKAVNMIRGIHESYNNGESEAA